MRHTLNRPTPRTMGDAWGHGPAYYDPFEHYTKPLHKRLSFWLLALSLCALAAIFLGVKYA